MDFLKKAFQRMTGDDLGEVKTAEDQPQDQKDLAGWIKSKVEDVRQTGSRVAHEGNWMTNYAYLLGYDNVYYNTSQRQYQATNMSATRGTRDRLRVNKILPTCQRRQAKLCKNSPRFEIRPDDSTQKARDQARFEQNLAEYYYDKEKIAQKRLLMMMGLQQCGHYYMHVCWDPEKGELLAADGDQPEMDSNGQPILGADGKPKIKCDYEYEGDVSVEIVSPFEMFYDPLATTTEEATWCIRARVRKLDYFKSRYPERGHLVKEESAWLLSSQYELRLQSITGQGPAQTGVETQMKNSAIELAYYEKRSAKHPNGRMVIIASSVVLEDKDLPKGRIPFAKFDDIPVAGKFYPEAIVTHLRPIQDQYNKTINKRAQWVNLLLAGKVIAPYGSEISAEAFNNQSGEILYYKPQPNAQPPTAMNMPMIPAYAYTEEDKLNAQFYDLAGESDISRGILPAAGIPAIGMQLLLEQDETRIAPMTEQHEYAMAEVMQLVLIYLEEYATNERMLKQSDPNFQYIMKEWSGGDLKSKHDLLVVRGSLAPASKATKRNDIINEWQQGLLGDPADPQVRSNVFRALETGDTSSFWSEQSIKLAQVQKTIQQIEEGEIPQVHEMDDHGLHIYMKNNFRMSDKYNDMDDQRKAVLLADIEEHLKYLMKMAAPSSGMTPDPQDEINMRSDAMMKFGGLPSDGAPPVGTPEQTDTMDQSQLQ